MLINEPFGWLWIFLGVVSGALMGLGFLKPEFLGGYAAPRRRLLRLGHISFFGLGALNILFAQSAATDATEFTDLMTTAGNALLIAGLTMPFTCAAVAWWQTLYPLFIVPVAAALAGTGLIAWEMCI